VEAASLEQLRLAVEAQYGATATYVRSVPVHEIFEGGSVWSGVVHIFDMSRHRYANRAYAWSSPIDGSAKRRYYAVLHAGLVTSPVHAVKAAIGAEQRNLLPDRDGATGNAASQNNSDL
jgi:hypothetical protein